MIKRMVAMQWRGLDRMLLALALLAAMGAGALVQALTIADGECPAGYRAFRVGGERCRELRHSGLRDRYQREPGRNDRVQDQDAVQRLPHRHLSHRLLRRRRRPLHHDVEPSASLPQLQPDCDFEPTAKLLDCGNWAVSAAWTVPVDATSGVYLARPVREDAGHEGEASHILFVVRDDDGDSDLLFQTSDTTWQAYNRWGEGGTARATASTRVPMVRPTRSATTGPSVPATIPPRTGSSTQSTRWFAGSSATATTSATSPTSTPIGTAANCSITRSSCPWATTSTGLARSAATSRPLARPACTWLSSAATRSTGRHAGRAVSSPRRESPHSGLLQGGRRGRELLRLQVRPRKRSSGPVFGVPAAIIRSRMAASPRTRSAVRSAGAARRRP